MLVSTPVIDGKQCFTFNSFDEAANLGRTVGNCTIKQIGSFWDVQMNEAFDPSYEYESAEEEPIIYGQM